MPKPTNQRSPKRCSSEKPKKRYRIRNWKEYNAALVQRGSLTVWIDEAAVAGWLQPQRSGRRGASCTYSDAAITAALLLKAVYHLPLRATQGMLASLLSVLGLELPTPHYSTLCRRQASLAVQVSPHGSGQAVHLVVDSTGCKVYGEGEWKVRQHGWSQRRTWRKLHLAIDERTGEILGVTISTNDVSDGEVLGKLLDQVEDLITQVSADGGYDQRPCYEVLQQRAQDQEYPVRVAIPPRHGARLWKPKAPASSKPGQEHAHLARNATVRRIREVGREQWKQESGYHRRSLAETTMFRYKRLIGERLHARTWECQAREAFLGCLVLNRMLGLGRPQSYAL